MRKIVLDTETTGLYANGGDRIIEIGCVEIINRHVTENHFHFYLNPERDSHPEALAIHGLTTEFLSDKPKFADIAESLCDYIQGSDVIIHNAPFDLGFLNVELKRLGLPEFEKQAKKVIDTLAKARELFPGRRNSLDALCERYEISNEHRTLHGALLDSKLLAEVYLVMTRGQESLGIDLSSGSNAWKAPDDLASLAAKNVVVLRPSESELTEHDNVLTGIEQQNKKPPLWRG